MISCICSDRHPFNRRSLAVHSRCGWQFIEQGFRVGQIRRIALCFEEPIDVQ
jgi:hypothetical protein